MDESTSLNFALILFVLLVVCFSAWLAERFHFLPARRRTAVQRAKAFDDQQAALPAHQRVSDSGAAREAVVRDALRQPLWLEYTWMGPKRWMLSTK